MAKELSVVTLKCPTCGASLGISADMDRFACGYCGTEQIVERRGGTVALKPIADAIAKVQVGTDKTTAELALKRLPQELNALVWQLGERDAHWGKQIANRKMKASNLEFLAFLIGFVVITPGLAGVFGTLTNSNFGAVIGLGLGVITSGVLVFYTNRRLKVGKDADIQRIRGDSNRDLAALDSRIRATSQKIEENQRIANS
ncbi:MAG: hypothetical protein AABN34_04760 [Acidobacteriota bacterium]